MSKRKLGQFLEWHGGLIRVTIAVPKSLQATVGKTKLKRALQTDSPTEAERRKWAVIRDLKAELAAAKRAGGGDPLVESALEWRAWIEEAPDPEGPDDIDERGTRQVLASDHMEELERSVGRAAVDKFAGVLLGTATPIEMALERYLAEASVSPRYKGDVRRAVKRLTDWGARTHAPTTLEGMTRRIVGRYVGEELTTVLGHRGTINKDISALSGYWKWLTKRGHIEDDVPNPWTGQGFEVKKSRGIVAGKERGFTDEEVARLLYGPASKRNRSIMWIAAHTGMRIDEICRLQVRDCRDGFIYVNARRQVTGEGKTDAAERRVPIHDDLRDLVHELCDGKSGDAAVIDGLPPDDPTGVRPRSAPAVKEFVRYRRAMGVSDAVEGVRRSLVNFHSWRRWFISRALDALWPVHIVAVIVGHADSRSSVTMGYADSPPDEQLRRVVNSVRVPPPSGPS